MRCIRHQETNLDTVTCKMIKKINILNNNYSLKINKESKRHIKKFNSNISNNNNINISNNNNTSYNNNSSSSNNNNSKKKKINQEDKLGL